MENYGLYDEIVFLKEKILMLENKNFDMKLASIQMAIYIGWSDEQIKNVMGALDNELELFRSCSEK